MRTPESDLLEKAEWYQKQYQKQHQNWLDAQAELKRLKSALERIRDCDWVITLPDRMDAVRQIAREALE